MAKECSNSSCSKSSCEGCASKGKSEPQNFLAPANIFSDVNISPIWKKNNRI